MKVLRKMGNSALRSCSLEYCFIQRYGKLLANMLLMVAVAIFTEGLYLNVTLALLNYIVTQIKLF